MRCPNLQELPPPLSGKTGWPWTEDTPPLPGCMADGTGWPRISVITVSFNYKEFIEEAIRSVLLQGYPNLEYIVIDGGSTDGTLDILHKYGKHLSDWVSEPDRGPTHAFNKGLSRSTGDVLGIVNSDDLLLPGALRLLAEAHARDPQALLLGDVECFSDGGDRSWRLRQANVTLRNLLDPMNGNVSWILPGTFIPRPVCVLAGQPDESLTYADDLDWMCRLVERAPVSYLGIPITRFRVHERARSHLQRHTSMRDGIQVLRRYWDHVPGLDRRQMEAVYQVHEASMYLGQHPHLAHFWSRGAGFTHLMSALRHYPKIVRSPQFQKLCLRVVLPKRFLRSNPWQPGRPHDR